LFKKLLFSFAAALFAAGFSFASEMYVIDSPTTKVLNYGSYDVSFRAFSDGGVHARLDFGVFKFLNLGVSWEMGQFLGNKEIKAAVPSISVKFRIYEGDMTWPGVALGYDGQGYFYNTAYDGDFRQRGKGLYIVAGRELFFEGLLLDFGLNMNDFSSPNLCAFINAMVPLYKESLFLLAEYDNISYFPEARLNLGVRFALTQSTDIDFVIRDCFGKKADDKVPNERVFKISYTGKF
jgi:hypothetical protein